MAISESAFLQAQAATEVEPARGYAVAARYDRRHRRVVARLSAGIEYCSPVMMAQGLAGASTEEVPQIEIISPGSGLHWPRPDADLYLPALEGGVFESKAWTQSPVGGEPIG